MGKEELAFRSSNLFFSLVFQKQHMLIVNNQERSALPQGNVAMAGDIFVVTLAGGRGLLARDAANYPTVPRTAVLTTKIYPIS